MAHLDHPSPHFNDAKMMLWGGLGLIVPFYTVQDCRCGSTRCSARVDLQTTFDNDMTNFVVSNRIDALKPDVSLFVR